MALSESVYFEARTKYETGQSLNSIARDLRISKSNLARIAKREGWEQGKYKDYVEASRRQAVLGRQLIKATPWLT